MLGTIRLGQRPFKLPPIGGGHGSSQATAGPCRALDDLIRTAPVEGRAAIVVALVACLAQLAAGLVAETTATPTATPGPDSNLSVKETAARLGISPDYIYRNSRSLPFVVRIGRRLLCSSREVERWNSRNRMK